MQPFIFLSSILIFMHAEVKLLNTLSTIPCCYDLHAFNASNNIYDDIKKGADFFS